MRVEQLQYLDAVIRHGSMRRAGEELHISQPALSESISNLERELGVVLLERRRSGAKISADGRELLPHLAEVLDAVERLRAAAGDHLRAARTIRIGTVNTATVPIVAPAIREFHADHSDAQVEVVSAQQADIRESLLDGSLDLGLVNLMAGDDPAPELRNVELVRGRAVVCCRPESRLAGLEVVDINDILGEPFVFMRPGYVMHRYMHRILGHRRPRVSYAADGAEMGKVMVAEGLGITVLPDYSIIGDPLERSGVITWRPLAQDDTEVLLVLQTRRTRHLSPAVRRLEAALVAQAALHAVNRAALHAATATSP